MYQTKAEAFLVHDIKKQLYYFESFQGMHNTIFQLSYTEVKLQRFYVNLRSWNYHQQQHTVQPKGQTQNNKRVNTQSG